MTPIARAPVITSGTTLGPHDAPFGSASVRPPAKRPSVGGEVDNTSIALLELPGQAQLPGDGLAGRPNRLRA